MTFTSYCNHPLRTISPLNTTGTRWIAVCHTCSHFDWLTDPWNDPIIGTVLDRYEALVHQDAAETGYPNPGDIAHACRYTLERFLNNDRHRHLAQDMWITVNTHTGHIDATTIDHTAAEWETDLANYIATPNLWIIAVEQKHTEAAADRRTRR